MTEEEYFRFRKNWWVSLNKPGKIGPVRDRSDFNDAMTTLSRLHQDSGEPQLRPVPLRRFVHINATTDPIENNHLAVCDETSLVSPDDYLASDLFMPGARLMQYGLSDHNAAKHRWC